MIPNDTEILITHGPPLGFGDWCKNNHRGGCLDLYNAINERIKPQYHVFGHVHESYGFYTDG